MELFTELKEHAASLGLEVLAREDKHGANVRLKNQEGKIVGIFPGDDLAQAEVRACRYVGASEFSDEAAAKRIAELESENKEYAEALETITKELGVLKTQLEAKAEVQAQAVQELKSMTADLKSDLPGAEPESSSVDEESAGADNADLPGVGSDETPVVEDDVESLETPAEEPAKEGQSQQDEDNQPPAVTPAVNTEPETPEETPEESQEDEQPTDIIIDDPETSELTPEQREKLKKVVEESDISKAATVVTVTDAAQKLIDEHKLNVAYIKDRNENGKITQREVQQYLNSKPQ